MNGKYQISNTGKVRSLNYNNTGKIQELKLKENRYGYLEVKLSKNNKTKNLLVSTLVGKAFIPNKNPDKMISHISKDIKDNSVENLKWVYQSEMLHNTYKRGRREGKASQYRMSFEGKQYRKRVDILKDYNVSQDLVRSRINYGWTLEEAIKIPVGVIPRGGALPLYNYNGEMKTLREFAEEYNVEYELIRKRIQRGWSIEEAINVPKLR